MGVKRYTFHQMRPYWRDGWHIWALIRIASKASPNGWWSLDLGERPIDSERKMTDAEIEAAFASEIDQALLFDFGPIERGLGLTCPSR